jgi:hypothetical protein
LSLKPQDVCVLLKIVAMVRAPWSYSQLAYELGMSASEVHAGVKRASEASLMRLDEGWGTPDPDALEEFLVHGVKYVFPAVRGGVVLGVPTSWAAPPLNQLTRGDAELPPVWPDPEGTLRGVEFSPLYKSVPYAARRDSRLYELLALTDAIRGEPGDRDAAVYELRLRLGVNRVTNSPKQAAPGARGSKRGAHGKETRLYGRRY